MRIPLQLMLLMTSMLQMSAGANGITEATPFLKRRSYQSADEKKACEMAERLFSGTESGDVACQILEFNSRFVVGDEGLDLRLQTDPGPAQVIKKTHMKQPTRRKIDNAGRRLSDSEIDVISTTDMISADGNYLASFASMQGEPRFHGSIYEANLIIDPSTGEQTRQMVQKTIVTYEINDKLYYVEARLSGEAMQRYIQRNNINHNQGHEYLEQAAQGMVENQTKTGRRQLQKAGQRKPDGKIHYGIEHVFTKSSAANYGGAKQAQLAGATLISQLNAVLTSQIPNNPFVFELTSTEVIEPGNNFNSVVSGLSYIRKRFARDPDASIVTLLIDPNEFAYDGVGGIAGVCGQSYLSYVADCMATSVLAGDFVRYAHEFGHLWGAGHDDDNAFHNPYFPSAHAAKTKDKDIYEKNLWTMMSYQGPIKLKYSADDKRNGDPRHNNLKLMAERMFNFAGEEQPPDFVYTFTYDDATNTPTITKITTKPSNPPSKRPTSISTPAPISKTKSPISSAPTPRTTAAPRSFTKSPTKTPTLRIITVKPSKKPTGTPTFVVTTYKPTARPTKIPSRIRATANSTKSATFSPTFSDTTAPVTSGPLTFNSTNTTTGSTLSDAAIGGISSILLLMLVLAGVVCINKKKEFKPESGSSPTVRKMVEDIENQQQKNSPGPRKV